MYAGSPYAGAPYAGGSAASTVEAIDGDFAGMVFLLDMWGDLAESTAPVVLPSAVEMRFDVVRVLPAYEPGTGYSSGATPALVGYGEGAYGYGTYGE